MPFACAETTGCTNGSSLEPPYFLKGGKLSCDLHRGAVPPQPIDPSLQCLGAPPAHRDEELGLRLWQAGTPLIKHLNKKKSLQVLQTQPPEERRAGTSGCPRSYEANILQRMLRFHRPLLIQRQVL